MGGGRAYSGPVFCPIFFRQGSHEGGVEGTVRKIAKEQKELDERPFSHNMRENLRMNPKSAVDDIIVDIRVKLHSHMR